MKKKENTHVVSRASTLQGVNTQKDSPHPEGFPIPRGIPHTQRDSPYPEGLPTPRGIPKTQRGSPHNGAMGNIAHIEFASFLLGLALCCQNSHALLKSSMALSDSPSIAYAIALLTRHASSSSKHFCASEYVETACTREKINNSIRTSSRAEMTRTQLS